MKSYVLDTHALVWYLRGRRVARAARRAFREIDRGRCRAWLPAIVAIELALLRDRRRAAIGLPELEATMGRNPELRILPLDLPQAREFALLPSLRDPFDRMVVAAARVARYPLITADERVAASGLVEVLWS